MPKILKFFNFFEACRNAFKTLIIEYLLNFKGTSDIYKIN